MGDFSYDITGMARSHICPCCLYELGRIRAVPDAHYGLGVVVCPRCSLASVRTRHPDRQFWRMYHRRRLTVGTVLGKTLLTVLMGIFLWGLAEWGVEVFADYRGRLDLIEPFGSVDVETALGAWLIPLFAMGIGAVSRAIYLHWRAIWAGVFILAFGFAWLSLEYVFGVLTGLMARLGGYSSDADALAFGEMIVHWKIYGILGVLVLIGLIPGRMLGTMMKRGQQKQFRRLRKKLRKRQAYGQ